MSQDPQILATKISESIDAVSVSLTDASQKLLEAEAHLKELSMHVNTTLSFTQGQGSFFFLLTVFVLACFVGYYVVWKVTPALHSPLMSVTNAISSVIIVGALVAAGPTLFSTSKLLGFFAVLFAAINLFGGFIVTERMLSLFKNKSQKG